MSYPEPTTSQNIGGLQPAQRAKVKPKPKPKPPNMHRPPKGK